MSVEAPNYVRSLSGYSADVKKELRHDDANIQKSTTKEWPEG